jgi:hypothetical protein
MTEDDEFYEPIDSLTSDEHLWYAIEMTNELGVHMLTATRKESEGLGLIARMSAEFPEAQFRLVAVTGIFMDNTRYDKMTDLTWYGVIAGNRKDDYITQIFSNFKELNTFLNDSPAERYRFVSLMPAKNVTLKNN